MSTFFPSQLSAITFIVQEFFFRILQIFKANHVSLLLCSCLIAYLATFYFKNNHRKVYLLDFACYKPGPECICTKEMFIDRSLHTGHFRDESIDFQRRILDKSGFGQKTYVPESLLRIPPEFSLVEKRKETETVIIGAIDELLAKTHVKARDIGILVVNSCVFIPTPSLSAMIVNHYKLRDNILSYNLGGMGCGAGLISLDLAQRLLQVHPNSYALVISTENINVGWYFGNERSMLVSNCLFRMGGAAILLSNISSDYYRSKYHLRQTFRTHKGHDDDCYNSVIQREDEEHITGVALSKDLMRVAGEALKANIQLLGKSVLPLSEQLKFLAILIAKKFLKKKIKPYTPNFKLAFEHFCIHTGGRAVQDELQKHLDLDDWLMEPSRMTLYRFGNTSSSSIWYELAYCEAKGRIKKSDRIWQIQFGSGFKCNSAVWRALRTIDHTKEKNPWSDEIHEFPVKF
ncbi:hypothetical protein L6164_016445 [Bauhinia variegata]|uniref:Uncharacterized protein n=1 Tax=Bauhinia variegata TaxID=167791 RepID=A0ACB9NNZ0_BAUVA|nr:hypothetical protein L6164_016445 [Bauhinia variegata]